MSNETSPLHRCRCVENVRTWSCALTARRSLSGSCDGRAARTLPARWEMRIPITWRYVCRPKIPLSACQNVRKGEIRKKRKRNQKKKKEQWDEALGFQAKSYRPVVSVQRSRGPLGWARGVQIDEMDLMPIFSLLQQQQQKTVLLAQMRRWTTRWNSRVETLHFSDTALLAPLFCFRAMIVIMETALTRSPAAYLPIRVQDPQT